MTAPRHTLIVGGAEALAESAPFEAEGVRSQRLPSAGGAQLVCIAFDAGAVLSEHVANTPILIQTVTGEVAIDVDGDRRALPLGGILQLDARVPHTVTGVTRSRIVVTILQGSGGEDAAVPGAIRSTMPVADVSRRASDAAGPAADAVGCSCDEADEPLPELDVRAIPHAIRHATVFGALDGLRAGAGMVLVAHHDPLPLIAQIGRRYDGAIGVSYGQRGPEVWRLQFTRRS